MVVLLGILTAVSLVGLGSLPSFARATRAHCRICAPSLPRWRCMPRITRVTRNRIDVHPPPHDADCIHLQRIHVSRPVPFRRLYELGYREEPAATVEYSNYSWVSPEAEDSWKPYLAAVNGANRRHFGAYLLRAGGPSGNMQAVTEEPLIGVTNLVPIPYDITNGTTSRGHLLRAQKG